jgi:hypothetical protein
MSNELRLSGVLSVTFATPQRSYSWPFKAQGDVSAEGPASITHVASTSDEQISFPADFSTPGVAVFTNLDDTNAIEVGHYTGGTVYPFLRLLPGESFPVRLGMTTAQLGCIADAGTPSLYIQVHEE